MPPGSLNTLGKYFFFRMAETMYTEIILLIL